MGRLDDAKVRLAEVAETDTAILADTSEAYGNAAKGNRDALAELIDLKSSMVEKP